VRPTPHRDRLQLAGAPEHVRLIVTLFSVIAAIALLLLVVPSPAAPTATPTAWADYGAMGRTLALFALLALAQSALVGATTLPVSARTGYAGAAFGAAVLHAVSPWLAATLTPGSNLLPLVTAGLLALCGLAGAALVVRGAWFTPVPVVERETVWPERGARRDGEARPPREGRNVRIARGAVRAARGAPGARVPAHGGDVVRADGATEGGDPAGLSSADREARDAERRRRGRGSRRRGTPRPPRPDGTDARPGGGSAEAGVTVSGGE
jgi:hypothetical protein